ncbi:hypothetical protein ILUMI_09461 [Ignelater luminosus]|uniref:Reverse transcriptase domain-containing protein n=1 Tax=Ignelater luminosus TaxID=2038154 RepID=A0A8K0GEI1_IGNLU|nr:hypothetical protein ILUMI_09461 [Ignelater luminosus]
MKHGGIEFPTALIAQHTVTVVYKLHRVLGAHVQEFHAARQRIGLRPKRIHSTIEGEDTEVTTIELEEIQICIKEMKTGKLPGPGDIMVELIKNRGRALTERIRQLMNGCMKQHKVPEEWKIGYISSLYKKGNRKDLNKYRGLSVTSTLSRLWAKTLNNRLREEIGNSISEDQNGFTPGSNDWAARVQNLSENCTELNIMSCDKFVKDMTADPTENFLFVMQRRWNTLRNRQKSDGRSASGEAMINKIDGSVNNYCGLGCQRISPAGDTEAKTREGAAANRILLDAVPIFKVEYCAPNAYSCIPKDKNQNHPTRKKQIEETYSNSF